MKNNITTGLSSCLYECRILHERFAPKPHRFVYRLFTFAFDLDELPSLDRRLWFLSLNRRNIFSLYENDFLPISERIHNSITQQNASASSPARLLALKERVIAFCSSHGLTLGPGCRVQLVTLPRVFGYQFNPVSFYFCYDPDGLPVCAIAEVTNTFREVKLYLIPPASRKAGPLVFGLRIPKHFYVSPFSDLELSFDFKLCAPKEKLAVKIDDFSGNQRMLHSMLTGLRMPLTDRRLAWFLIKYPLITLKIMALIHWQALRLWLKQVPFFSKAANAGMQRDLYRPHPSIATRLST